MSLIQPEKFRSWKTELFKMPCLEMPRFQMAFKVTVASGLYVEVVLSLYLWRELAPFLRLKPLKIWGKMKNLKEIKVIRTCQNMVKLVQI